MTTDLPRNAAFVEFEALLGPDVAEAARIASRVMDGIRIDEDQSIDLDLAAAYIDSLTKDEAHAALLMTALMFKILKRQTTTTEESNDD